MDPGTNTDREERSRLLVAFLAGACVVLLVAGAFLLVARLTKSQAPGAEGKLPFGSAEQAYAQQIHFQGGPMSQSTNLLNQDFTYASGTVSNNGPQTVRAMEVTFEFRDPFNQIVLRDPQRLIEPTADPLKAGQSRDFQVTLGAHLPTEWNRQYPAIHVTGLILE